jgi:predicted PurR-regulated permease PerM
MMKNSPYKKYIYISLSLFLAIALAIIVYFLLLRLDAVEQLFHHMFATLMPFVIGLVLAYIICPLCNTIEKLCMKLLKKANILKNENKQKKLAFNFSVFAGIIIALVVIYLIISIIVPQLIVSIIKLVQILPDSADRIIAWSRGFLDSNEMLLEYSQQIIDKASEYVTNWLSHGLLDSVQNIATSLSTGVISIFTVLMNIFIGVIVAIYMLLSRKKLARQSKMIIYSIFKKDAADTIMDEVHFADRIFSGFINGKILDAVIVAVICYVGMMIFKGVTGFSVTMSELLVAVIVGIFNVIPFFGWYLGLITSALLILIVNPVQCIFFVVFDVILQQIDGNILGPKILGNTTGLSSFWVLFAILLFGDLWGFAGMLLGVPVFAVIYHIISRLVAKGLRHNGQEEMLEEYARDFPQKQEEH